MDLTLKTRVGLLPRAHGGAQSTAVLSRFGNAENTNRDRSALVGTPKSYVLFGSAAKNLTDVAGFEQRLIANRGFNLSDFQREAMKVLERGESVVVPAPTSSGKTLVAEYGMEDALVSGKRVFYTAPRKAISNEKYFEFCARYGKENIGMMTGDVTVNPNAPIVLMTTEVLRNMLYQPGESTKRLKDLQYIVFDECHFINDKDRGMVWEEATMYARRELPNTQQIHLSATVQNSGQYAAWLNSLNTANTAAGKFSCISSDKRPVPLTVQYLTSSGKLVDILDERKQTNPAFEDAFRQTVSMKKKDKNAGFFHPIAAIQALKQAGQLPLIEFVFGREKCEKYARAAFERDQLGKAAAENAENHSGDQKKAKPALNLTTPAEREKIRKICDAYIAAYPSMIESKLLDLLEAGIGYHHADMYIREKELVEVLLKEGLLKTVFATSTLAEGVNVPAQSVGLSALDVHLPTGWRPISESEYQQATGRAGRLGWYKRGYAVLSHPQDDDMKRVVQLVKSKPNPVMSQFKITPYQALNFITRLDQAQVEAVLNSSFKAFQAQSTEAEQPGLSNKQRKKLQREAYKNGKWMSDSLGHDFNNMKNFLKEAGFLQRDGKTLTTTGQLAAQVPMESSLLIARAVEKGLFEGLEAPELAALVSSTVSDIKSAAQKEDGPQDIGMSSNSPVLQDRLRKLEKLMNGLYAKADAIDLDTDIGAGAVDKVASWARTHKKSLLDDSPGLLTYTILRTANMLKHIAEATSVSEQLRDTALQARTLLLDGVILEQVQPKKVEIPA